METQNTFRLSCLCIAAVALTMAAPPLTAEALSEKELHAAIMAGDLEKAETTILYLQSMGGRAPIDMLAKELSTLPADQIAAYWLLVRGISGFGDRGAINSLTTVLDKNRSKALGKDIMFGLQGNTALGLVDLHETILAKASDELAIMSAEQLGEIKTTEALRVLVQAFAKHPDSKPIRFALGESLERLANPKFGDDGELWASWWSGADPGELKQDVTGRFGREGDGGYTPEREKVAAKVLVLTQHCTKGGVETLNAFDRIEDVCGANQIEFAVMDKDDFGLELPELSQYSAVLINCSQFRPHCHGDGCKAGGAGGYRMGNCTGPGPHDGRAHLIGDRGVAHLKLFVAQGGYLFTEDWGLIEVLRVAYPNIVGFWPGDIEKPEGFLSEQDVDVNPPRGETAHHLLRGVYQFHEIDPDAPALDNDTDASTRVGKLLHLWHIDSESPAIAIKNKSAVTVLLESRTVEILAAGNGACAITFIPGKNGTGTKDSIYLQDATEDRESGRVLHILSHFTKQSKIEDDRAIKRLLLNFIDEAALAWNGRQARDKAGK